LKRIGNVRGNVQPPGALESASPEHVGGGLFAEQPAFQHDQAAFRVARVVDEPVRRRSGADDLPGRRDADEAGGGVDVAGVGAVQGDVDPVRAGEGDVAELMAGGAGSRDGRRGDDERH
jgi:hypothetical protein